MARVESICNRVMTYSFYLLFGFVPFIFTPFNFELFEFNKMWAVYVLTIVIMASWLVKMVIQGQIKIQRTPLDIPILLFLAANILSTIFSIDPHTSIWGYYSRFNGGLLSIISYILLYYVFVSNFANNSLIVRKILIVSLISGTFIAVYGVLEHFGIDKDYWVQDVQNRVFSTLGQPNWLAAYLSILIPITIALGISSTKSQALNPKQSQNLKFKIQNIFGHSIFRNWNLFRIWSLGFVILFYTTLLFTKSRSGFVGFWLGLIFFLVIYFLDQIKLVFSILKNWLARRSAPQLRGRRPRIEVSAGGYLLVVLVSVGLITFVVGSPFEQLNKFTLPTLLRTTNYEPITPKGPALETGGTESGEIRKIVWQGAVDIARHNPLFGTGVETFAWSYFKYRPVAHNQTSEWDFLYNKAHNEYLNYLANTGLFGLGSYLLMIGMFLFYFLKQIPSTKSQLGQLEIRSIRNLTTLALLAAYISILVSNFFGFSVVVTNLYFFLIPALVFVEGKVVNQKNLFIFMQFKKIEKGKINPTIRLINIAAVMLIAYYILLSLVVFWLADVDYGRGYNFDRSGQVEKAYLYLTSAINKRDEPTFKDALSANAAVLATAFYTQDGATASAKLIEQAIILSDETTQKHPNVVTFWKTRARMFYTLSGLDEKYIASATSSLERARLLSPTDPRISYNLALLYGQTGNTEFAIKTLEETVKLKPNYRDAYYALGIFYDERGERQKAIEAVDYILKNIATQDAEATELLLQWRGY